MGVESNRKSRKETKTNYNNLTATKGDREKWNSKENEIPCENRKKKKKTKKSIII